MQKNKQKIIAVALILITILLSIIGATPIKSKTVKSLEDFNESSISASLTDGVLTLENMIKDKNLTYAWNISQVLFDKTIAPNDDVLYTKSHETISFACSDVTSVEIIAKALLNETCYISQTFSLSEDLTLSKVDENDYTKIKSVDFGTRDINDIVSLAYLAFVVIIAFFYYIIPKKYQWILLLIASIYFYILSGAQYILFITLSSLIAYLYSLKISKRNNSLALITDKQELKIAKSNVKSANKTDLLMSLIVVLGFMVVIKYLNFFLLNTNSIFNTNIAFLNFLMPLGLSFYTFKLISYTIDVSRGKITAESNFSRFFLYAIYFPQITQGPISRYEDLGENLKKEHTFSYKNICFGAQRILWGFFIKLVLADRISLLVTAVFDDINETSWLMLIIALSFYSIQIYADFYSSMEIALGTSKIFGIDLAENFLRPYFSTTMPEFWRRWHVTLGTWFKDYVFFPISTSKPMMKLSVSTRKKYGITVSRIITSFFPIMGVWVLTGLWHGASWNFVYWGLFHGFLILLSTIFSKNVGLLVDKLGINRNKWDYKFLQMVKVFALCTIGRVFFKTTTLAEAFGIFGKILSFDTPNSLLYNLYAVLEKSDFTIIFVALSLLLISSIITEKFGSVLEEIDKSNIYFRWTLWIFLIFATLIYGVYGENSAPEFIYELF